MKHKCSSLCYYATAWNSIFLCLSYTYSHVIICHFLCVVVGDRETIFFHRKFPKIKLWMVCLQQDETTQRHEEYLRSIREKAFEMSVLRHSTEDHSDAPELTPYDKNKLCIICNVLVRYIFRQTILCDI